MDRTGTSVTSWSVPETREQGRALRISRLLVFAYPGPGEAALDLPSPPQSELRRTLISSTRIMAMESKGSGGMDIPNHEEVLFDLSTSCTVEQAVMRMLGWADADIYRKGVRVTEEGLVALADLDSAHPQTITLRERLADRHEHARQALIRGAENDAPYSVIEELSTAVEESRRLAAKARGLLMDIEEELEKGEHSALRLDKQATKRTKTRHITIRSLEKWMRTANPGDLSATHGRQGGSGQGDPGKRTKGEESVYVTLALAVSAFAQRAGGKFVRAGVDSKNVSEPSQLNMSEIYDHLEELAGRESNGAGIPGQTSSSIKKRVDEAFRIKRRVLNAR